VRWTVTPVARGSAAAAVLVLLGGLALGRADLVVLAGPVGLVLLLAVARGRPSGTPAASARSVGLVAERAPFTVTVELTGLAGAQLAVVRLPDAEGTPQAVTRAVDARRTDPRRTGGQGSAGRVSVPVVVDGLGWGERAVACPDLLGISADAVFTAGPTRGAVRLVTVLPAVADVGEVPLPPRSSGLVGTHRTRRPGDGADLLDVREFATGDRLRRIDWRVTARHGRATGPAAAARIERLYVRRTAVDADADLVLCVDTRLDLGEEVGSWSRPDEHPAPPGSGAARPGGSLDVAVRAAAGLAAGQLRAGDRVAMVDLGRLGGGVRAGTGRRHLQRLRLTLARCRVQPQGRWLRLRTADVRPGATVVVLSPFADNAVASFATALHRRGDRVLAVDTLPAGLVRDPGVPGADLALDLVLAERGHRLRALAADGVPVLRWDPAVVTAALSRMRRVAAGARR